MRENLREDSERGIVIIDGVEIPGSLDRHRKCQCGSARVLSDEFDAYFCPACNQWLESACNDPSCAYCRQRPEHPLSV
jgi:hypothetical protein